MFCLKIIVFHINIDGYKLLIDPEKISYYSLQALILVPQAA